MLVIATHTSHLADSYQRWFCVGNKSLLDELGHFDRLKLGCQKSATVLAIKVLIQISSHAKHLVSLGLSKDILAIDTLRAPERGPTAATVTI